MILKHELKKNSAMDAGEVCSPKFMVFKQRSISGIVDSDDGKETMKENKHSNFFMLSK